MTEEEKTAIADYRRNGCGYKKIGQLLGVSENTVKTYCRRNGLSGYATSRHITDKNICKWCGAKIRQTPGKKTRKFCSDSCRNHWWNSHLYMVERKANYNFVCPVCGKRFVVYGNKNRKYCSHACYIKDRFGGDNCEGN